MHYGPGSFWIHDQNHIDIRKQLTVTQDGRITGSDVTLEINYVVETYDEVGTIIQFRTGEETAKPKVFIGNVEKEIRFNGWKVYFADAPTTSDTFSFTYAV